jgi:O-antigen/teichoic acid export membrane protein
VSLFGAVASQADKVIVSIELPLTDLGYYALAYTATGPLAHVAASIATAALPRFTGHLALAHPIQLSETYQRTMHVLAFTALLVSLPLIFFAPEILQVWTGSSSVADATETPLRLLAAAALLNAVYALPYTLALASGHSRLALVVNATSTPIIVGVTYLAVTQDGIRGAAAVWLIVMASYLAVYARWVHKLLLPGGFKVFVRGMLPYATVGVLVFAASRAVATAVGEVAVSIALLVVAMCLYGVLGGRVLPTAVRGSLGQWLVRPASLSTSGDR